LYINYCRSAKAPDLCKFECIKKPLQGEEYLYETLLYRTQEIIINKDIS